MPPTQPDQPNLAPPDTPYDFIVNKEQSKSIINPLKFSLPKNRLIIAISGGLILLILIIIFVVILSNLTTPSTAQLVSIVQEQNELAQISATPAQSATSQSTQTFAITTNLSMLSQQQLFLAFLHQLGSNPSSSILTGLNNPKVNADLAAAQTDGTYDQTYISIAQSDLTNYQSSLKQAAASTKNLQEQKILQTAYNQAQLLIQQSQQHE